MENFDNNIRTRLDAHGTQLPDAMFERVMGARKKKRNVVFWWYIGPVFGLIGGLTWYGLSSAKDSALSVEVKMATYETKSNASTSPIVNPINSPIVTNDRVGEGKNIVKAMKRENKYLGKPKQTNLNQTQGSHSKMFGNSNNLTFEQYATIKSSIKTKNNVPDFENSDISVRNNLDAQISNTQKIDATVAIRTLAIQKLQFERKFPVLFPQLSPEVVCPSFRKSAEKHWFVEGNAGYGLFMHNMKAKTVESNDYLKIRQRTERSPASVAAALRIGLRLGNGFVFKTGIEWQQANRIFEVKIADYELITRDPVSGAIVSSVKGERYKKTFNRSQFVQVPLLLGYERGNKNWRIGITGGLTMNIYAQHKGDVLSPLNAKLPITYTDGDPNQVRLYNSKPGLGVQGALQVMRHLNHGVWLYVAPQYDMVLKAISTSTNPINEKIGFLNVTMGVRKEF